MGMLGPAVSRMEAAIFLSVIMKSDCEISVNEMISAPPAAVTL